METLVNQISNLVEEISHKHKLSLTNDIRNKFVTALRIYEREHAAAPMIPRVAALGGKIDQVLEAIDKMKKAQPHVWKALAGSNEAPVVESLDSFRRIRDRCLRYKRGHRSSNVALNHLLVVLQLLFEKAQGRNSHNAFLSFAWDLISRLPNKGGLQSEEALAKRWDRLDHEKSRSVISGRFSHPWRVRSP
jgi:hypothetical protein